MYVQAYGGSDVVGTGEFNSPVATLTKAVDVIKTNLASEPDFDGGVKIILGDGVYNTSETIELTGTEIKAPKGLYITNQEGAKPVISGGVTYNISDAVKVTDESILSRLHSENAKNNLYVLDLGDVEIPDPSWYGEPSFGVEKQVEAAEGIVIPDRTAEVAFDGELMTVARWPNDDVCGGYRVTGTVSGNTAALANGTLSEGFTIACDYENLSKWATADQALIFGYLKHDWAVQTTPLGSIDAENKTITSKYASYYGIDENARYYVFNLLEEIDVPGEYFIERKGENAGKMYFYMPESCNENSKITLASADRTLLKVDGIDNVNISGITFESTLGDAIRLTNTNNSVIRNCEIRNISRDAIVLTGRDSVIENNYIHDTNGGIEVNSPNPSNDAKYLIRSNNLVTNNEITRFSRLNKVYVDAIFLDGVGNTATHNEIYDGDHLAIRFSGQYHTIQYNEIYDVLQECDDAGAIYVGRTWLSRGNKILNNYFHDMYTKIDTSAGGRSPVAGIFLDDHYAGAYIEGNVFANIYGDGVRSNRGRESTITNNIFVNCTRNGISLPTYAKADTKTIDDYPQQKTGLKHYTTIYDEASWRKDFAAVYDTKDEDWPKPEKFTVTDNITINTQGNWSGKCLLVGSWPLSLATAVSDNIEITFDPGFGDLENGDFTIDLSKLKKYVPNFKDVEFNKMGRQ